MGVITNQFEKGAEKPQWSDLLAVGIRTTDTGPFTEDLFWQFLMRDGYFEVPGNAIDSEDLDRMKEHLPNLDWSKMIQAAASTDFDAFRLWHFEDSARRFSPEALRERFRALTVRLSGTFQSSVYDELQAAWSSPARHYHNLEHLEECLSELLRTELSESSRDRVELALWYHDVVYHPGAADSEEQSATRLLEDGMKMGMSPAVLEEAAELVRSTAHAGGDPRRGETYDAIHDIDLAILGRDPLRFLEFDCGVGKEFSGVCGFYQGRRRFLGKLLETKPIYRTEAFRSRYEASARSNLEALLASDRYRESFVTKLMSWVGRKA